MSQHHRHHLAPLLLLTILASLSPTLVVATDTRFTIRHPDSNKGCPGREATSKLIQWTSAGDQDTYFCETPESLFTLSSADGSLSFRSKPAGMDPISAKSIALATLDKTDDRWELIEGGKKLKVKRSEQDLCLGIEDGRPNDLSLVFCSKTTIIIDIDDGTGPAGGGGGSGSGGSGSGSGGSGGSGGGKNGSRNGSAINDATHQHGPMYMFHLLLVALPVYFLL